MTRLGHSINLLPRSQERGPFLLQLSLMALVGASITLGLTLLSGSPSQQRADISEQLTSTPAALTPGSSVLRAPQTVSAASATSLATGDGSDTVRYYEPSGRALQTDLRTGRSTVLSDRKLSGFIQTWWPLDGSRVVSKFQDAKGVSFRSYDYQTNQVATIGKGVQAIAIAPSGTRVVYAAATADGFDVSIANIDGSSARKILDTRATIIDVRWPTNDRIIMVSQQPDHAGRDMISVTLDGAITVLMRNRVGLEYVWSRDGQKLLFSYFSTDDGLLLKALSASSGTESAVPLATTARKCAWHDDDITITCGIPIGQGFSSAADSSRTASIDDVVSVDTLTGIATSHWQGKNDTPLGVLDPIISSTGSYFVFFNVFNQRIYSVRL